MMIRAAIGVVVNVVKNELNKSNNFQHTFFPLCIRSMLERYRRAHGKSNTS